MGPKIRQKQETSLQQSQTQIEQLQKQKEKDLKDKEKFEEQQEFVNQEILQQNAMKLSRIRTYGTLNAGVLSGLLGFSSLGGIVCYLLLFFIISFLLLQAVKFEYQHYFLKKDDIMYNGIAADIMLFIMSWIISHNLTNIL